MARKQKPNYSEIPAKVILGCRTNWQDIRYPLPSPSIPEHVRRNNKQSDYCVEMKNAWLREWREFDMERSFSESMSTLSFDDDLEI